MKSIQFLLIACLAFSLSYCKKREMFGLKDAYKNDFLIGTAINARQIQEKDSAAIPVIVREFNSITPENVMKSQEIHPTWDKYNFDLPDKYVAYGNKNKLHVVGHTLVWHSQLTPAAQRLKNADSLRMFMKDHITTVAGRYAGKINGWDVVNEALNEDGTMRKSVFYNLLGDEYILDAFRLAAQAAPNTELYYNDYNIEQPQKRAGAIALIKKIQAAGLRIDGVGIQGHWATANVPMDDIEQSIKEFGALGIKVMFTELDITALPNPWDLKGADVNQNFPGSPFMNPYANGLPEDVNQKMAKQYEDLFRLFLKYKNIVSRVTLWGVSDANSWLNGWPIRGRTNYPLLFDRQYKPKLSHEKVMALKKK